MSKLLELGYPRHPAMKNLVPHVLDRIQAGAATGGDQRMRMRA